MTNLIYNNERTFLNMKNIEIENKIIVNNPYQQLNSFNNEDFLNIFYNLYLKKLEFLIINKEIVKQKEIIKNLIESNNIMILSIINDENDEMIRLFDFFNKKLLIFSLYQKNEEIIKMIQIINKIKGV
jgi:hypothetical protein